MSDKMIKRKVKVIVLTGDGVNCEKETAHAFNINGAHSDIVHINDLEAKASLIHDYDIMALPGGFSFGDDLGSGKIFALKIEKFLGAEFKKFIQTKKPIIGICNGLQVLSKLGAFSDFDGRYIGLAHNNNGKFIDQWESLEVQDSPCIWTKGIKSIKLPIRHGEGRFVFNQSSSELKKLTDQFIERNQIVLTYQKNPNGSHHDIAGICDATGLVFGLMPHPEAAIKAELYPGAEVTGTLGSQLFLNAINYSLEHI